MDELQAKQATAREPEYVASDRVFLPHNGSISSSNLEDAIRDGGNSFAFYNPADPDMMTALFDLHSSDNNMYGILTMQRKGERSYRIQLVMLDRSYLEFVPLPAQSGYTDDKAKVTLASYFTTDSIDEARALHILLAEMLQRSPEGYRGAYMASKLAGLTEGKDYDLSF
jgi:hypothetical protein